MSSRRKKREKMEKCARVVALVICTAMLLGVVVQLLA